MTEALDVIVSTREGAHKVVKLAYERARDLIADGKEVRILAAEAEDDRSVRQNRFYWGAVLREISEQAKINGERWAPDAWHQWAKREYLGYAFVRETVAGRKRKVVRKELRSTTKLSVKRMSEYLDKVMAFAATDLGVVFSETKWERYRGE